MEVCEGAEGLEGDVAADGVSGVAVSVEEGSRFRVV